MNYNYDITKIRNETKTIYQKIIQEGSKHHTVAGETQWKNKITNINFQKIWKNTFTSNAPPPSKDLHYRLLHYSTKSNNYMHKCSKNINPNCKHCGLTEDNLHLFTKCKRISKVWKHYQPLLTKLLRKSHTPLQHTLTISVISTHKHTIKLTLTITQLILFEIWQSRNNNKYDKSCYHNTQ